MPGSIAIGLNLPAGDVGSPAAIEAAVETLVQSNLIYLAKNPRVPPMAKADIRYRHDPGETPEKWLSIPEILLRKSADCKSLSAWRIAELRLRGIPAKARVTNCRHSFNVKCGSHYHISVEALIAGRLVVYDPSRELGM